MIRFVLVVAALIGSSAAGAQEINHQARIGSAVARGCNVQQVHTPAGKMVHNAPIVTCVERTMAKAGGGEELAAERSSPKLTRR